MRRQHKPFTHATVFVHTNHLETFAAISRSLSARIAFATVHVRLDGAAITWLYVFHIVANRHHLNAQFVTGNDGVSEERHFAEIAGDVRAANPHAMHLHQCLARPGLRRFIDIGMHKMLGLIEYDGFHFTFETSCSPGVPQCGRYL